MATIKILLVEDDILLAGSIAEILEEIGNVTHCNDGEEGLYEAQYGGYDLLVLDIMLPLLDGYEVLKQLRANGINTATLLLTAKDSLAAKIEGFKNGADDYLTKPFYREELLLRAQAMLKRSLGLTAEQTVVYRNTTCDLTSRCVTVNDEDIILKGKEFDLLLYFIKERRRILTKEQIFERIWGFDSETTYTVVEVYMSNLRKKLKQMHSQVEIHTIRNVGYILTEESA